MEQERFLELMEQEKNLTAEEERAVFTYYKENPTRGIRNAIAMKNVRLIWRIIHVRYSGFSYAEDLFQEGFLGLLEAVERYDTHKNAKFSTYANVWISKYILHCIKQAEPLKIPTTYAEHRKKVEAYVQAYKEKHNHTPDVSAISKDLRMHREVAYVCAYQSENPKIIPFSAALHEEDGRSIEDTIPDPSLPQMEFLDAYQEEQLVAKLKEVLTDQEYALVIRRCGFCGYDSQNINQLSKSTGMVFDLAKQKLEGAYAKIRKLNIAAG